MLKELFKKTIKLFDKLFCIDEHTTLLYDFEQCKNKILHKNREEIIQRLIPSIRAEMLKADGLLITDKQARKTAIEIFKTAKEMGDIDCMNRTVKRA